MVPKGSAMAWKLHTRNNNFMPPAESWREFPSKDDALRAACVAIRQHWLQIEVRYIEGFDGERIELDAIEAWCGSQKSPPG